MKEVLDYNAVFERFCRVIELSFYLQTSFDNKVAAQLCGSSLQLLDEILIDKIGFSSAQIIERVRLWHARDLMIMGVEYNKLFRCAGFSSKKAFERALNSIVY